MKKMNVIVKNKKELVTVPIFYMFWKKNVFIVTVPNLSEALSKSTRY